ncbi:SCO5918 family protein [Streptomyces sp. NPDC001478]
MRCVIARFPFELTKNGVLDSMKDIKPEEVVGGSVTIGRRAFPLKQVGEVVTGQDRRDFTADEVFRAMTKLGFTCRSGLPAPQPVPALHGDARQPDGGRPLV